MSTNLRINALKTDIISDVATTLAEYDAQELDCRKKSQWTEFYATKAQEAGVKELAFMLKGLELSSVCDDYLKVEYREGANKNNRMMLSKRFIESFDDKDVETWFSGCEDQAILASICSAMGYETTPKTPIRTLRQVATAQVYEYGERIVLQRLNIDQLRAICEELNIEGSDYTSSKSVLVNAIMTNTDIEKSAPKKRITRTKKKAIEDATKYQELFQHYYVADLQEWAAANGLKVSGTKKVLIERILAFNAGDTENTMATANTNRAPRKAATKKAAPAPNPPTKRVAAIASGVQSSKKIVCDVPKVSSKKSTAVTKNTKATTKKATNKTAPKSAKAPKKKEPAPVEVEEEEDEEIVEEEIVEEEDEDEVEEEDQMEQDDQESGDEQDAEGSAEDESADEEASLDEEAEKAAIDAERELRTVEDEEEEEPSEEMMLSEVSNDFPTDITGKLFAVSGLDDTSKHTKKELVKIITANGGQIARTLTKNVDVVITKEGTPAYKAALKVNIPCYGEEYLTNFF